MSVKKLMFAAFLILALILTLTPKIEAVKAAGFERVDFLCDEKIFSYELAQNIKKSSQFDRNYEINKYNRFSSKEERKALLKRMLNAGIEKSVAIEYLFPNITKLIAKMEKVVFVEAKNATISVNTSNEQVFKISKEQYGKELNKPALFDSFIEKYLNDKEMVLTLPTNQIVPEKFKADYEKFTNLRADFSTNIASSSPDRKHNIKNALNSLNRIELMPNQIFSFNKAVGKRTAENGYREAKIIVNNEFVDGLGGGVCQVSTTLYNSALLAGLEIVEANKHSKQVNYVKYGFDAMVNFGSSDLKFKNNTNQKITIITNFSPNRARIRIFGESLSEEIKLTNEIVSVTEPQEEIVVDEKEEYKDKVQYEDESFYLKKPVKGMEIKSYREHYKNGELVKKELLRFDKFKVQNAIKVVGAKRREPVATDLFMAFG